MSASLLAKGFAGDLAIFAEVYAADHEADRLASTKQSAWCPAWRPGNFPAAARYFQMTTALVRRLDTFHSYELATSFP